MPACYFSETLLFCFVFCFSERYRMCLFFSYNLPYVRKFLIICLMPGRRFVKIVARVSPHPSALLRPCLRPSERVSVRSVPSKPPPAAPRCGFDGTEQAGTRSDGRKQGRNSADGCGEGQASVSGNLFSLGFVLPRTSFDNTTGSCIFNID